MRLARQVSAPSGTHGPLLRVHLRTQSSLRSPGDVTCILNCGFSCCAQIAYLLWLAPLHCLQEARVLQLFLPLMDSGRLLLPQLRIHWADPGVTSHLKPAVLSPAGAYAICGQLWLAVARDRSHAPADLQADPLRRPG